MRCSNRKWNPFTQHGATKINHENICVDCVYYAMKDII